MELAESNQGKNHKFNEVFSELANTEKQHYDFWKKYSPKKEPSTSRWGARLIIFMSLLFGTTFAIKFLEKHETKTIEKYKSVAHLIPEEDKSFFEGMIVSEEEHEHNFRNDIQSSYVKYISFVILGLADAIVEISGIHAGSLGIYDSTRLTGFAGIIAGAAGFDRDGLRRIRPGKAGIRRVCVRFSRLHRNFLLCECRSSGDALFPN